MTNFIYGMALLILGYFAILWTGYLILLLFTALTIVNKYRETTINPVIDALNAKPFLPITIIIPAYNETTRIINAITAVLQSDYRNIHIIIVNDGSQDKTLQLLINTYALVKVPPAIKIMQSTGEVYDYYISKHIAHFMVIDKQHSPYENSAADCINAGLNACRTPLYVTVDADTTLEPQALSRMLFTYLITPHCIAVGGAIYVPDPAQIVNGRVLSTIIPDNPVLGVQVCEYLRSFIYGRQGWSGIGGALCHPGAFTLLETKAVQDAGGYDAANFSYDAEVIMQLHHHMRKQRFPYRIAFAASAIAWSEEPDTLVKLWGQRNRWQRGLLRCLSRHKAMVFNPFYGITGLIAFPYYILFEIFGPVVEALSYLLLLLALYWLPSANRLIFWCILLAWTYMLFITLACTILSLLTYDKYHRKNDILHIVALTLFDMVFYRQWRAFCALFSSLHYVYNRLRGKAE
jgi:cellulose synthase/poly-beta-1,6-N-acetylglucosamine synthase-like glycosyltransferase